jgi:DNA-binding SARP family transcriptional activator/TolB-like protein
MARGAGRGNHRGIRVRLLGKLGVAQGDQAVPLPASRKVRALFAYLALAPRPVGRSQLCELLWDVPNDPRGELRWSLSKIRSFIGQRVVTAEDAISLDLSGCFVDALEVERAARAGVESLPPERQRELAGLIQGDFLEGLELDRAPAFGSWLTAQRRRFRAVQAALLEHLAASPDDDEAFAYLDQWVELAPFDRRVHERLLTRLAARGRLREGEEHLARAAVMFEEEGLDVGPLRATWKSVVGGAHGPDSRGHGPLPQVQSQSSMELPSQSRRASIAVMPFVDHSGGPRGRAADALAHDVTTRLAKLRSMFVIAQGSTFALAERRIGPEEAGRMLNVDYVVSGSVRQQGKRLTVTVDLVETRTAHVVWSEIMDHALDDAFMVLEEIGNRIVASIASEIETIERNRAILRPPSSLDAWESHHRGLWHMYRFTREDNEKARQFFQGAVKLDPTFSRAYAGLSFTHFQDSFLGWGDRKKAIDRAFESAGQSLMADERDPAAHWAMGRALWLRGGNDDAVVELKRTIDLSPNFALGHYTLAFVQAQTGDPAAAIASSDASRVLSPFDPLLFAMLGSRAIAMARMGQYVEAAEYAVKAASRPNAHPHIYAIAACTLALAGRLDAARVHVAAIRRVRPQYGVEDFLVAFRFEADGAAMFRKGAKAAGLG